MATNSPYSRYYKPVTKPLTGDVAVPGPNDPVDVSRQGNTTYMDFGIDEQNAFGNMPAPVTQSERGAEALLRAMGRIPDMPRDLMRMDLEQRQKIGALPQFSKPEKPTESYGLNRGGSGKAGRGTGTLPQFGQSQFDTGAGYEPLEMKWSEISDKPWELDENTNVDVSPGTSLTPKPETNLVDKEPDLQSPRGMYEALAKKYPDLLTQNLDQLQQGRVTMEDVDQLRDQSGLGSLFIAASKAASGAGSIGGKTAESIAPTIVQREDTLARQRLKDRMDVASENMALNAKAVDLAMKQINFADEREQYDPNSEVSKFARQFMRDEFQVNVPDDVPAYQLKQFLPAVVQKYQAQETGAYRNAMLQAQATGRAENLQAMQTEKTAQRQMTQQEREAQRRFQETQNKLNRDLQRELARDKAAKSAQGKTLGEVPANVAKAEMDLAHQFSTDPVIKKYKSGQVALAEMERLKSRADSYGDQGLISGYAKILDPESVVREGEYATVERGGGVLDAIKNRIDIMQGKARLQPAQREQLLAAARALQNGRKDEYNSIRQQYESRATQYGLSPQRMFGVETPTQTTGGGLSPEKKARLEELRKKLRGGQ